MYDDFIITRKKEKYLNKTRSGRNHRAFLYGLNPFNGDFTCACCGLPVSADARLAAVNNRNHCPYCLASRHMDWREPGDRLSACKEVMRPIALSAKRTKKKYGLGIGELLLVHCCDGCGKVSANRLAADDDVERLRQAYEQSFLMDSGTYLQVESAGVHLLTESDWFAVISQLSGNSSMHPEKARALSC